MITRRILRIKILQVIFSSFFSQDKTIDQSEKELFFSIDRFYDLYHQMLYFVVDLRKFARNKIDIARSRKAPTYEDLHPNMKFVENQFINQVEQNDDLVSYLNSRSLGWSEKQDFMRNFYELFVQSDLYHQYMSRSDTSYQDDKSLVMHIYARLLSGYEPLYQQLEEQSIYWNDEVEVVIQLVLKTFKDWSENMPEVSPILPLFRQEEDKDFAKDLLRKTILRYSDYDELIKNNSQNWDLERIAIMDIIIMKMAITEMLEFTSIPTKVTFDEYIDLAKFYSTAKSNVFINGMLDKIVAQLKAENRIQKQGRGLIGGI